MDIRSYRAVFDLERRIYRIDRLRLNPSGVPVRGVIYFLLIFVLLAVLRSMPLLSLPLRLLPWYLSEIALPGLSAALLASVRLDGRPFHAAAWSTLAYAAGPRQLRGADGRRCPAQGGSWRPSELMLLPDGSDAQMRDLRYTGPGAVLISAPHHLASSPHRWGSGLMRVPHLTVSSLTRDTLQRRKLVVLRAGARLEVIRS